MSGLSAEQERQIRELISAGNKIAAVKLYRELTSLGLKEAKDAVEAIEHGIPVEIPALAQTGEPDPFLENQIKRLLAERKKIEAVKIYREAYHCGLKDAKDAVDLIQAGMHNEDYYSVPSAPTISNDPFAEDAQCNRRFSVFVLAFIVLVVAGAVFFFLVRSGF